MSKPSLVIAAVALALLAQAPKNSYELDVAGTQRWMDSGVDVQAGDTLLITATGALRFAQSKENGPEGLSRGWRDLVRALPINEAGRGALIGRIGSNEAAQPFPVGSRREIHPPRAGRLFLGINQTANESAEGSFHVKIEFTGRGSAAARAPAAVNLPRVTAEHVDKLPSRIADKDGNAGDRVNFLIWGAKEKMRQAFQAAGWVQVDRSTKDALLHGVFASLSKQAYTQLPMSELNLFGRAQDFGMAHADPIAVVAARHHLRLWKAPIEIGGQTLWVGAGTHDIGFERDQRNNSVTHKIDPEVDKERDFIGQSLNETGLVAKLEMVTPSQPITGAKTATGGSFRSDGKTLVIYLTPSENDSTGAFADLFCSVLQQENPDGGDWGGCDQYLHARGKSDLALAAMPGRRRVLIVPGIMNSCASNAPAFQEGQQHLRDKHGLTVELLAVPNDSCEANARQIAQYLREHMRADSRKYIVVGYSKGAPDLQVALATEPDAASAVAAFITVAGAIGGSPIADALPGLADRWMQQLNLGGCKGDLSTGLKSLRRDVRQAFLARYPNPVVPTFSLAAVSDKTTTSKMLQQAWQLLSVFDPEQDAQLTKRDAIVPGATYLGAARADHLAVALPFDKSEDKAVRAVMDKGRYPRAALLEALVRFVDRSQ